MQIDDDELKVFIGIVCSACTEHGLDYDNDIVCPTCPVGHLYDILVGNEEGDE